MCSYAWTETCSINSEHCFAWEHFFKHSYSLPFLFPLLIQCAAGCLTCVPFLMGAQSLVSMIYQLWEQSPSRSWLPIQLLIYNTIIYFFRGIKLERQRYTIREDYDLIKFVKENQDYYPVKGCKLYKKAEKAKVWHVLLNWMLWMLQRSKLRSFWSPWRVEKIFGD